MASCIDVYSYWPLTGMHVEYKDPSIQDFYEELFMDENSGLNYQEFLPEMLHEYWLTGESFPLGHFNELLGIWEYDELINADDVKVIKSPFMREPRFELKVPEEDVYKRQAVDLTGHAILWNGSSWSPAQPMPDSATLTFSVSCPTASRCLVARSDGSVSVWRSGTWSAPQPVLQDGTVAAAAVSCASALFCAVADTAGSAATTRT